MPEDSSEACAPPELDALAQYFRTVRGTSALLPTEAEWEFSAGRVSQDGNFADSGRLRPMPAPESQGLRQMFGDVREWTNSAFLPYPRFRAAAGAVGEYNAKFMSGQYVLRGGSCATAAAHIRKTYRNFFPPSVRWQFSPESIASSAGTSVRRGSDTSPGGTRQRQRSRCTW